MVKVPIILGMLIIAVIIVGCARSGTYSSDNPPINNPPVDNTTPTQNTSVAPPTTISYDAQIIYKTYGGFINPKYSTKQLIITPSQLTYTIYSTDGAMQRQINMPMNNSMYTALVDSMNTNGFLELDDGYGGQNPDVGKTDIVVSQPDITTKTITIGTIGSTAPDAIKSIVSQLSDIASTITNPGNPDFTLYGYDVLNSTLLQSDQGNVVTAGPYTFNIPSGTFSQNVTFDVLRADPSLIAAFTPENETTLFTFALRVRDADTNQPITSFSPITMTLSDNNIDGNAKYYNVAPDDTFTLNSNGFSASSGTLTHPISGSSISWAITEPMTASNNNVSNSSYTPTNLMTSDSILVDNNGMTLYTFAADVNGMSTCYGSCATYWPPVYASSTGVPPSATSDITGNVSVTQRTDGTYQVTYNGMPLYYYVQDKYPGDMTGNNLDVSGGYWYIVNLTNSQ